MDFNPRSPHGERLQRAKINQKERGFQSTLPAWGATWVKDLDNDMIAFQSTLPAWGATVQPKHTAMTA